MPIPKSSLQRRSVSSPALAVASLIVAASLLTIPSASSSSGAQASLPKVRDGSAGSSGDAARGAHITVPTRVGPTIPGLDVSHWQGVIDWARVGTTPRRFVFVKATDGDGTVDPTFVTNRDGAKANGLMVGTYHFARPDPSQGDAQTEARFFVNQVDPAAGDLLPVLDIEVSGGLNQTEMTHWAQHWVAVVRRLTGVTPLVYTSPNGWLTRFGDTTALADDGSPLWVAHWDVPSPTLPAEDWGGKGWVVWQHSSTGHVPGIATNVDLDKLAGTRLGPLIIRRLSLTLEGDSGQVSSSPAELVCRSICARNVDPNTTVTLTATPDDHAYFTGWGGDCAGTDPTCTIAMHGDRSVSARFVTDITPPTPTLTHPFDFTGPAVVHFDEPTRGVTPFNVVLREQAGGGNLPVTRVCRSLHGVVPCSNVNVWSVALTPGHPWIPGRGYVALIDPVGVTPRVKDKIGNATPTTPLDFEGPHGLEETRLPVTYTWGAMHSPAAYGGSFAVQRQPGATLTFAFRGPSVTWYTVTGPAFGKAEVLIDGRHHGVVDLWARHRVAKVARTFSGLRRGSHTIGIRALGLRRSEATDRLVAVDAFRAGGGLVATPRGSASWRRVAATGASGGGFAVDDLAGAAVTLRFDGIGVNWTSVRGPDRGRVRIYVDDMLVRRVDLYSATRTFGVVESIGGLTDGPHRLRIEATGTSQAASTGTLVTIDRFDVT
jgi:GH25 family lysozyme M1 (1,4-beta-N-acetylmuramidase)